MAAHKAFSQAEFRRLADDGKIAQEIAAALGLSVDTTRYYARRFGVTIAKPVKVVPERVKRVRPADPRIPKMVSMHRQGLTLEKIGQEFSITRERVRQILKGEGVTRFDGGICAQAAPKKAIKAASLNAARNARSYARYGISHEAFQQARKDGTLDSFSHQKSAAASRGIGWTLSYAEWRAIWDASGKLAERGRGKGKYCMSRIKDDGPYSIGNVHIQLCVDNSREAVKQWKDAPPKANRGVYCLFPGSAKPWVAKHARTPLGRYATEAEAVAARAEYFRANPGISEQQRGKGYCELKGRRTGFQVIVGRKYVGTFKTPEMALAARAAFIAGA